MRKPATKAGPPIEARTASVHLEAAESKPEDPRVPPPSGDEDGVSEDVQRIVKDACESTLDAYR
jgi:hypothetical protein